MPVQDWDAQHYYGRYNKYPFTEVVSFVLTAFGDAPDRSAVRILDLGCGGGHHLLFLAQEGFRYYGIDGSGEAIKIAAQRLSEGGFPTDTIVRGTFDRMPFETGFFDCVLDRGSLTCNSGTDLPPLIAEARRVLKPGGRLFSLILHEASTAKDQARPLGNNDFTDFPGRLRGAGVLHFTSAGEAREFFAGLRIDDIELLLRQSQFPEARNTSVTAWMLITCTK